MHTHLLTNEELRLLLSHEREETELHKAERAAIQTTDKQDELEHKVKLLEAALADMGKRIAFLEAQLSVRQSAAALAGPEPSHSRSLPAVPSATELLFATVETADGAVKRPDAEARASLSRLATYKRERKSWFRK